MAIRKAHDEASIDTGFRGRAGVWVKDIWGRGQGQIGNAAMRTDSPKGKERPLNVPPFGERECACFPTELTKFSILPSCTYEVTAAVTTSRD